MRRGEAGVGSGCGLAGAYSKRTGRAAQASDRKKAHALKYPTHASRPVHLIPPRLRRVCSPRGPAGKLLAHAHEVVISDCFMRTIKKGERYYKPRRHKNNLQLTTTNEVHAQQIKPE